MNSTRESTSVDAEDHEQPWLEIAKLAGDGERLALDAYLESLSIGDQALALSRLSASEAQQVLETLSPEDAAELLSRLSETQAAQMVSMLGAPAAAAIVHELPSNEKADLLGDIGEKQADAILEQLPAAEAAEARELVEYEDDVAGGLMIQEILRFAADQTVGQVIDQLSENQSQFGTMDIRYGYVCDEQDRLVGVLPMQALLFVRRSQPIQDVMIADPISLLDTSPFRDLLEVFDTHAFLAAPVVDASGELLGVVRRRAVDHEAVRAAEADYLKSQGIIGGEELRTMPLWLRSRRRLSWLSLNVILNVGAAAVIALFQDTLQSVIALAVFLPIISDMSGCSGNQAGAVSMRELSLGLIRPSELIRVWWQEVQVGLINGFALGVLVAICAMLFNGNAYLGMVVGFALMANTVLAVSIGGTLPLILKRFGFDPAVAAGPLLTTVTDMCGFFLVLGSATLLLEKLV